VKKRLAFLACVIALALLLAAVPAAADKYDKFERAEVTKDAPDTSVELVGYITMPHIDKYPNPPLVILLHEASSDHSVFDGFAKKLATNGIASLAMDLRGYGLSIYNLRTRKNRNPGQFYKGDFEAWPHDVAVLLERTIKEWGYRLDTTKLAVVGTELGASVGILWAENEPRVIYTALISPGLERKTLRIASTVQDYGDRPLYLACSDKDIYAVESCYLLSDIVDRVLDLEIYEGFLHGAALLNASNEVQDKIIADLRKNFEL
jgi:pimeloyl-ACP methyl ester carboxylesterase